MHFFVLKNIFIENIKKPQPPTQGATFQKLVRHMPKVLKKDILVSILPEVFYKKDQVAIIQKAMQHAMVNIYNELNIGGWNYSRTSISYTRGDSANGGDRYWRNLRAPLLVKNKADSTASTITSPSTSSSSTSMLSSYKAKLVSDASTHQLYVGLSNLTLPFKVHVSPSWNAAIVSYCPPFMLECMQTATSFAAWVEESTECNWQGTTLTIRIDGLVKKEASEVLFSLINISIRFFVSRCPERVDSSQYRY